MANKLEIPEDRLFEIGFRLLDIMYGELTMMHGTIWDNLFIDNENKVRLEYRRLEFLGLLGYQYYDARFFFTYIPVESEKFEEILMSWFGHKYKLPAHKTLRIYFTIDPTEL